MSERGGVSPLVLGRKPSLEELGGLRRPAQRPLTFVIGLVNLGLQSVLNHGAAVVREQPLARGLDHGRNRLRSQTT